MAIGKEEITEKTTSSIQNGQIMTSMSDKETNNLSHDWHLFDILNGIECRNLMGDIYQIKNATHFITMSRDVFNSWLENPDSVDVWLWALPLESLELDNEKP